MSINRKSIFYTVIIALSYLVLIIYLRNFVLINDTFLSFSLSSKLRLYTSLIIGMTTSMTNWALFLILITSILTGANIVLIARRVIDLKKIEKVHFAAGGSSILALVGGGCAACGLPIISLLGLSGSLLFLPFKGAELPYFSIFLLLLSLYFLIKSNNKAEACEIK